ncbi:hypothetical protein KJR36_07260 [Streptococcus infantarius subsp. infantarius]|nr:hypothetical protein [Streptococcus infantarius]MBT0897055.1 hypothetical protein [Streptococcus infantarius subsp. infantarius]MBT0900609.1 hypothetical protein [Streptococcus infantarius subsp. infantarius]MBT0904456.1 hypothetical protein [Streptococcus infantarius subsp. infantarius]MBT0918368.1 hypothetical protein [Streptococcus infantarius subsp. infantarius]MBT0932273.1 hypothetical protein [Streptococcus infantarius subsp. infantarius]
MQQNQKNISPIKVMLLLVVIAFVGVLVGFFNPADIEGNYYDKIRINQRL